MATPYPGPRRLGWARLRADVDDFFFTFLLRKKEKVGGLLLFVWLLSNVASISTSALLREDAVH